MRVCAVLAIFLCASCAEKKQSAGCCTFSDLPETASPMADQGRLEVMGSTAAYYAVLNEEGEPLSRKRLNEWIDLIPGRYLVNVNGSGHYVEVEAGRLARCATGTLMVTGHTDEQYAVSDSTNRYLAHAVLAEAISLFPGGYRLSVNNTETTVTVRQGELTTARTGSLTVHGSTSELFYVLDDANQQLGHAGLEESLAFFPGAYAVKVNNTSMKANVSAGGQTELQTGNILVKGLTDEYYYVTDTAGNALNYQSLNKSLAFFPGNFLVRVNNTVKEGQVLGQDTTEFVTGSLVLNGPGANYYYVLDESGNQLTYNTLNRALSFFPARYTVKLGASVRKADVAPGHLEVVNASE